MYKKIAVLLSLVLVFLLVSPVNAGETNLQYEKNETVRVKSDAYGNVDTITVENLLKTDGKEGRIVDYSILSDIKNTKGDEEYKIDDSGYLIWDNQNENITYKGTTDKSLPVDVKVTYFLDDKEISAEDILGKSGKVKIRFDYTNNTLKTIDGYDVHVPFLCVSALTLPTEHFKNVKTNSGKIIDSDDSAMVLTTTVPGLKEDLNLSQFDFAKDIELEDYAEVEMDATDFELELTATIVTTVGINEIDELDDVNDLIDGMRKLTDASSLILDGTKELNKGMSSMVTYFNQYFSGVSALDNGLNSINQSLKVLTSQKKSLDSELSVINENVDTFKEILNDIEVSDEQSQNIKQYLNQLIKDSQSLTQTIQSIENLISQTKDYQEAVEDIKNDINNIDLNQTKNQIIGIIDEDKSLTDEQKTNLKKQIQNIDASSSLDSIKNKVNNLPTLTIPDVDFTIFNNLIKDMQLQQEELESLLKYINNTDLNAVVKELSNSMNQVSLLINGVSGLSNAIDQLYNATQQLSKGSNSLVKNQDALSNGLNAMSNATATLSSSYAQFDEGIQKLNGDELEQLLNRFKAIQKAEKQYDNYSGKSNNCECSVMFIYETEEIK